MSFFPITIVKYQMKIILQPMSQCIVPHMEWLSDPNTLGNLGIFTAYTTDIPRCLQSRSLPDKISTDLNVYILNLCANTNTETCIVPDQVMLLFNKYFIGSFCTT